MQGHGAAESVALLLGQVGDGDDQRAAVLQVAVHLAGRAFVVGQMVVVEHEHRHLRAQIELAVLADRGDPRQIVLDEGLHLFGERCHMSILSLDVSPAYCTAVGFHPVESPTVTNITAWRDPLG